MKRLKRWLKISAGICIVVIGLILMPIPGPGGTPVTLAGLAILATELPFAKRLQERFLILRAKHFDNRSPAKRFLLIGGTLVGYAVVTMGFLWVWAFR